MAASPTYEPKKLDISIESIHSGRAIVEASGNVLRTPLLSHMEEFLPKGALGEGAKLWFKMENMQTTGSFKIRGATLQFHEARKWMREGQGLICYSGGNYGKAFAFVAGKTATDAVVLMPDTVPADRAGVLSSLGASVELHPYTSIPGLIAARVASEGRQYLDPFDDINLVRAYGALGLEIIEEMGAPDVVLVPCGGGGLLSGIAAGLRLSGLAAAKIYGVEPVTANTMARSFREGRVAELPTAKSVATGLVPIRSGDVTYPLAKRFVDGIIEVTDEEIIHATRKAVEWKLVVEASGAAGIAAVLSGKLPCKTHMKNVVIVVSGGNISLPSLHVLTENINSAV